MTAPRRGTPFVTAALVLGMVLATGGTSARAQRPPMGRAQTWQPVNVGVSMISRASVWSPSPARVPSMNP